MEKQTDDIFSFGVTIQSNLDIKLFCDGFYNAHPYIKTRSDDQAAIFHEYYNPFTFARFTVSGVEHLSEDGQKSNYGLTVNLEFGRPHYFLLEMLEFLRSVFEYLTSGNEQQFMQNKNDEELDRMAVDLTENWERDNREWILRNIKSYKKSMRFMPRPSVREWWEYMFNYRKISIDSEMDLFVPRLFLQYDKQAKKVIRVLTWSNYIPQVFPKCDIVLLLKIVESTDGTPPAVKLTKIVSYDSLVNLLGSRLVQRSCQGQDLLIYDPEDNTREPDLSQIDNCPLGQGRDLVEINDPWIYEIPLE